VLLYFIDLRRVQVYPERSTLDTKTVLLTLRKILILKMQYRCFCVAIAYTAKAKRQGCSNSVYLLLCSVVMCSKCIQREI